MLGRIVARPVNEFRDPAQVDYFDFNAAEHLLASGVYFYTLTADGKFIESKKMVLLK